MTSKSKPKQSSIKAREIIQAFYRYVDSREENRLKNVLSYNHGKKIMKAVNDLAWDEVESREKEIKEWLRLRGAEEEGEVLSARTIEMAWTWLARSYEYAVLEGLIPENPFKKCIPKPRTGSYIA